MVKPSTEVAPGRKPLMLGRLPPLTRSVPALTPARPRKAVRPNLKVLCGGCGAGRAFSPVAMVVPFDLRAAVLGLGSTLYSESTPPDLPCHYTYYGDITSRRYRALGTVSATIAPCSLSLATADAVGSAGWPARPPPDRRATPGSLRLDMAP